MVNLLFMAPCFAIDPVPVTCANLNSIVLHPTQEVSAHVFSTNHAQISSQTYGEIQSIKVDVGQKVQQGEILAVLACDDQTLNLQQAQSVLPGTQAKIALHEWQLKQTQTLANQNNISKERIKTLSSELNWYQSQLSIQKNQVSSAQLQVQRCTIKAPFSGVITQRSAQLGEFIQQGSPLFKLLEHDKLEVKAYLHPSQISLIPQASKIYFKHNDKTYPLTIKAQVAGLDNKTHTQEIRLTFTGQHPMSGTIGTLVWEDPRPHLPAAYISKRDHQYGLFLNIGDKAHFVELKNAKEGSPVALPVLLKGDLILEGRHQLKQGDPITLDSMEGGLNEVG